MNSDTHLSLYACSSF